MKILLTILFTVFLHVAFAQVNYYVDASNGNDANSGKSPALAWKTLDKVHNQFGNIKAGDSVLLKRGETWKEQLYIPASGAVGNNIVIAAYGTGAKPIVTFRDTLIGWSNPANWTQVGNAWYMSYSAPSGSPFSRLWINGGEVKRSETNTLTSTEVWSYDINTSRFYIYSATNPATSFTGIETYNPDITNTYVVWGNVKNYVTLSNLDIRGGFAGINLVSCTNWLIKNCDIGKDCGGTGIGATYSNAIEIANCTFNTGHQIVYGFESKSTNDAVHLGAGCNNWLVHDNTLTNWGHSTLAISNSSLSNPTRNNKFYKNYITAPDIDYGRAFNFDAVDTAMSGNEAYNNIAYNTATQNQFENKGFKFYNNIINTVRGITYRPGNGYGIAMSGYGGFHPEDMQIYNNTIVNCIDGAIHLVGWSAQPTKNNSFTNNILAFNGSNNNGYQIVQDDENTSQLNNTWKNNLLYATGVTDLIYYGHSTTDNYPHTVSEFNAESGTAGDVISGNITGDPLFISATNFRLQSGSPAINSGINVGLPFNGTAPDIGAYEYNPTGTIRTHNGNILMHNGKIIIKPQ